MFEFKRWKYAFFDELEYCNHFETYFEMLNVHKEGVDWYQQPRV